MYYAFTRGCIVLCESIVTDTLESSDGVTTVCIVVTRVTDTTLVYVVVTVLALEANRTLGTAGCRVADSVTVMTVAVTATLYAPRATRTGCNSNQVMQSCNDTCIAANVSFVAYLKKRVNPTSTNNESYYGATTYSTGAYSF